MHPGYAGTANALRDRIVALIETNPEIMDMESAWDLLKVEGFACDDLAPSAFQASWALKAAKETVLQQHGHG